MSTPSEPTPPTPDVRAFASIDLGASADETVGQATGRRIGGAVLMIVSGVLTLASLGLWAAGWAIPGFGDWWDAVVDVFPFLAVVFFILTALGFELLRRGRKRKGEAGPEPVALMGALDVVDRLDGPDQPDQVFHAAPGVTTTRPRDEPDVGPMTTETRL